jgi:hypothetical protein
MCTQVGSRIQMRRRRAATMREVEQLGGATRAAYSNE